LAPVEQRGELVGLEIDVTREVLEPLGAEASLCLRSPECGFALHFI
jgi:hypothetical protein